jgi:protoporphyrinogen oxidase
MKIGIIGGGLAGLSAAHALLPDHEIDLYEKMPFPGGCLSSYTFDRYSIERYYHHCFSGDRALFSLLVDLELSQDLEWRTGTTAYYSNGRIYPLNTPAEILKYPDLSIIGKARLALLTLQAKKADLAALDDVQAEQYIIDRCGRNVFSSFFEPLLRSKFGQNRSTVSAAWLMSRIAIRSDRSVAGERLGYLKKGFQSLIDALVQSIQSGGGRILTSVPVDSLVKKNDRWILEGEEYDAIVSTIPPGHLKQMGGPALPDIPYQGAACMTIGLERDVAEGMYWVNMKDNAPYGAVISHTNFVPAERYGEHIVYLGSYFSGQVPHQLDRRMLDDFCQRFSVRESEIHWHRMTADAWAGPIYTTGYRSLIPPLEKDGIYLAGMFSEPNYPERSMEGSIRAGFEAASRIREKGLP